MSDTATSNRPDSNLKPLIIAYLVHLLVPLLLLADVVLAWRFPSNPNDAAAPAQWWVDFGTTGQLVFVASAGWLALGLLLFGAVQGLKLFSWRRLQGPLISIYAVILTLFLVELGLNFIPRGEQKPALWPPGQEALLKPDPKQMPGVQGAAKFTGNDVGLRGPNFPTDSESAYKIVTIGGSTTESLYLDDSEEWPHLLMERLNARRPGITTWAANGGQSGRNTTDHLELIRALPVLSQVELLIFLIGINDMNPTLSFAGRPTQETLEANSLLFRKQVVNGGRRLRPPRPYFKRTELFELGKRSSAPILEKFSPSAGLGWLGVGPGSFIENKRQQRAAAATVPLPGLEIGLEEYRGRIQAIAAECRGRGLRCLFLTQPTIWREDLTPKETSLLWFGWVRRESQSPGYLSVADLATAMDAFNRELLSVCASDGLECFDLASRIPKDTSAFYDDAHFNESGARLVADQLAGYLSSKPPFAESIK